MTRSTATLIVRPDGTTDDHIISRAFTPTVYDEYAAYEVNGTSCAGWT